MAVRSHLALLRELGAKVMVFAEVSGCIHGEQQTPVHLRPRFPPARWAEYGAKLTAFARYTQALGVQIAYHHHMGTVIESAQDIDNLMIHTGEEVGLLLDTGHLTFAGRIRWRWHNAGLRGSTMFIAKMCARRCWPMSKTVKPVFWTRC